MDRQKTGTQAHRDAVEARVQEIMAEYRRYMASEDADEEAFIQRIQDMRDEAAGQVNPDEVELAALSEFLLRIHLQNQE